MLTPAEQGPERRSDPGTTAGSSGAAVFSPAHQPRREQEAHARERPPEVGSSPGLG
jgi:hypothetical protein